MKKKHMSNEEAIKLFEIRDKLIEGGKEKTSAEIVSIDNQLIRDLGFLVYNSARKYRLFSNYEDLVQEGFIGLIKATRHFNHKLFPNFFVYAERWIKTNINKAASKFDVMYSPDKSRVIYLNSTVIKEELCTESPEEEYIAKESGIVIDKYLANLSERDGDIIRRIFGLNHNIGQTLREIGPIYELTRQRIHQIKNQIIGDMKKNQKLADLC